MDNYDIILRNGTVIDGSGAPRVTEDVGIRGACITAMGDLGGARATLDIDVSGRVVTPGFIDAHTHDDRYLLSAPGMPAKLSQGVTTVITGNCGLSLAPWNPTTSQAVPPPLDLLGEPGDFVYSDFAGYLSALEMAPAALNAACLVGHSTLRVATLDTLDRAANDREIGLMQAMVREALASGAIGLSSGLNYPPAVCANRDELEALVQPLRELGGIYASHIRDEGEQIIPALDEACAVGAAGSAQLVISHHKLSGQQNHGRSVETLRYLAQKAQHQPVALDCYPYNAGSSMLRMNNVKRASRVLITRSAPHPEFTGQNLDDIARQLEVSIEQAVDALQPAGAIYFMMDERDVQRILAFPHTMIGSDGLPHDIAPHPRLWGAFPRVLGHYCRDLGLFSLETAIYKMTGLTAQTFGLPGRGLLAPGMHADITVFDPDNIADMADWLAPTRPAAGIDLVIVNGILTWRDGGATGERAGRVIRMHDSR